MSGDTPRREFGDLSRILDPDLDLRWRRDVGWRKRRLVRQALQDFNDQADSRLQVEVPGAIGSAMGLRRAVTFLTADPDLIRYFLNRGSEIPRRLLTMAECYAPHVRFVDVTGGQETTLALENGRFRSPELLRNPQAESRRFRYLLEEVGGNRQAVRVTAPELRHYIHNLRTQESARFTNILTRAGAALHDGAGGLEFIPLARRTTLDDRTLIDAFRGRLLVRLREQVARTGLAVLDGRTEQREFRLARRFLDGELLQATGLRMDLRDEPPPGRLVFRPASAGAGPVTDDRSLVESFRDQIIARISIGVELDGRYLLEQHRDPLGHRLALRYLDAELLTRHQLVMTEQAGRLEFYPLGRALDQLLDALSPRARLRLRELMERLRLTGDSVVVEAAERELIDFLGRPDVGRALERERDVSFVGPAEIGDPAGDAYLTRLLRL